MLPEPLLVPQAMVDALDQVAAEVSARLGAEMPEVVALFRATFGNTLETTVRPQADGTIFVITGDIPAMWLRDSAAQVRPYLLLAERDESFADLLVGVIRRQMRYLVHDPYANAFNETANGARWDDRDVTAMTPLVWERKFELDSHCYPFQLAHQLYLATGRTDHLDEMFVEAMRRVLDTWDTETEHETRSDYRFYRPGKGLERAGLGSPTAPVGLIWCGFRPSDDECRLHYLIPANAFAAVVANRMVELLKVLPATAGLDADGTAELAARAGTWAQVLRAAVESHGVVSTAEGEIYAYEVDGLGGHVLMDDANVPSLLSLPYLGWCDVDDSRYLATRSYILSTNNPYYYEGSAARGIGSPHLGEKRRVWPIALAMQGLTTTDERERAEILRTLAATTAGTGLMHEEFGVDDPSDYTRPWFAWANAMFSELVLVHAGLALPGTELPSRSAVGA